MTTVPRDIVSRLAREARCDRWGVSDDRFGRALAASADKGLAEDARANSRAVARYLGALRLEDLALACACADGHDAAWEHFVRELRPALYRAADAIEPQGGARDLADALYAELFGMTERGGERASLFRYYHGRSSLATWLRAVLAQRHVDRVRERRRTSPLPEEESAGALPAPPVDVDSHRERDVSAVSRAFERAVTGLSASDRIRLGCYYAQGLTLSQTAKLFGEHEATASRHLTRIRREIRAAMERHLRSEGLSDAAIARGLRSAAEDPGTIDLAVILGRALPPSDESPGDRKKTVPDRSPQEKTL